MFLARVPSPPIPAAERRLDPIRVLVRVFELEALENGDDFDGEFTRWLLNWLAVFLGEAVLV